MMKLYFNSFSCKKNYPVAMLVAVVITKRRTRAIEVSKVSSSVNEQKAWSKCALNGGTTECGQLA